MTNRKRNTPLYLGKELYGNKSIEEVFKRALKPYFVKNKISNIDNKNVISKKNIK